MVSESSKMLQRIFMLIQHCKNFFTISKRKELFHMYHWILQHLNIIAVKKAIFIFIYFVNTPWINLNVQIEDSLIFQILMNVSWHNGNRKYCSNIFIFLLKRFLKFMPLDSNTPQFAKFIKFCYFTLSVLPIILIDCD